VSGTKGTPELGITAAGLRVLTAVCEASGSDPVKRVELRDEYGITCGSVYNKLEEYEERGWVKHRPDPTSPNGKLVRATDEGREALAVEAGRLAAAAGDES